MASSNPAPTDTISASTPGGAADMMMPITITHLVMIAVAIGLTILMIWWGNRLWRQRRDGREDLIERGETTEVGAAPVEPEGAATAPERSARAAEVVQPPLEPPVPIAPPVAPAPPPLADEVPATPAAPGPSATKGDLTILKGLGPKAAAMLAERGIADVEGLAALTAEQAAALDADLGPFSGRMTRDRWHEQARLLAAGDRAQYETIFGKLGAN